MEQRVLTLIKNAYFLLLTHTKQLLLVTICNPTAGIGNSKVGCDDVDANADADVGRMDRREG